MRLLKVLTACFFILLATTAFAQVDLVSPPDGAALTEAPEFGWAAQYEYYHFYSVFYYDLGVWQGYYPADFWTTVNGFPMPTGWWDNVGLDTTCYWAVLGANVTGQWAVSDVYTFTKTEGCEGQCAGEYTLDCDPSAPCICFTTAEGTGVCIDDFYCETEACGTSADCPGGEVCIACSYCASGRCAANECTNGGPNSIQGWETGGLTAAGR